MKVLSWEKPVSVIVLLSCVSLYILHSDRAAGFTDTALPVGPPSHPGDIRLSLINQQLIRDELHCVPWRWPSSLCCGKVGAQPCSWSSEPASITSGSWRGWPFLLPPAGLVPQQTQVFLHVFLPSFLPLSSLDHLWLQAGCGFPAFSSLLAQVNLQ